MRLYRISCPRCFWKTPMPVDSATADEFRKKKYCLNCKQVGKDVPFTIRETIVTGPTPYFPRKS